MEKQESLISPEQNNCENFESWTIVREEQEDAQANNSEIIHSEDSDGISVISDSELCKTMSENEMEKDEKFDEPHQVPHTEATKAETTSEVTVKSENLLNTSEYEETCYIHKNPRHLIFGAGLFVIIAIFYSHVNSLRIDIQKCNEKIQMLQTENQDLKIIMREIQIVASKPELNQQISGDSIQMIAENNFPQIKVEELPEIRNPAPRKPPSKTVWLGSETDKVEILDKKYELPDYCYKTEEDDLIFEYIQEKCDQKRRKLAKAKKAKELKTSKTLKNNEKKEWSEKNYDDYIQETLKSLNVEIQEIKKKRTEAAEKIVNPLENSKVSHKKPKKIEENPPTSKYLPETSGSLKKVKNLQEKQELSSNESFSEKPSKSKRKKQKRKDRTNWVEDRTNGREEARNLQDENNNVNWYLNRKNERELDRLQA